MKRTLSLLLSGLLVLTACKKDKVNTEDNIGNSRVTRFATFDMRGSKYVSIVQGSTYVDSAVTATENGRSLTVTTTGTVDASAVGVYDITYSATNSDGFASTVTRTVAVLPEPEAAGVNIAGKYQNIGSFAYTAQIDKLAPGFYVSDNVWGGSSAAIIPSYLITTNGNTIIIPTNYISAYGGVEGNGTLDAAGNLNLRVWLLDQGVSNSLRKWKKI